MPRKFHCTMQAAQLLLGVERTGLVDAVEDYLGLEVPKELQLSDWGAVELSPGQVAYAAADAVLAYRLWPPMKADLEDKHRSAAYRLQRNVIPAVVDMELRGLGFDRSEHARQVENWSGELTDARHAFVKETGKSPPTKPNEMREWLKTVLDDDELQQWPKTPTGKLSVSKENLSRLANKAGARPVLDILAKEKLLAAFGVKLRDAVNKETGRLHTHYGVAATKTGRFTSSNPNPQQLPSHRAPEFKRCIVARPGHLLIACDWSAMEMRAAAWASQDVALNAVFAAGLDFHRINAAAIQGIPVEEVTQEQRNAAKPVAFGSIYGMSARGLVRAAWNGYRIEMSEPDARLALENFFGQYPELKRWMRENADRCQRERIIHIGCGRVVEAGWEPGGIHYTQACNLPIQGICADAMMRAIILVYAP